MKERTKTTCDQCGKEVAQYRKEQRFCGRACRIKFHNNKLMQRLREADALIAHHKGLPRDDQATRDPEQQQLANVEANADFESLEKTS